MVANTLIHREYTSPYQAKFVIEKDRMYQISRDPKFIEGDIFRIIVPLADDYSFDFGQTQPKHDAESPGYADTDSKLGESTGKAKCKPGNDPRICRKEWNDN